MSSIMESVNQRTQLVGQNRLELLLFRLNSRQRFGINVFKVKEVLQCPPLTKLPRLNNYIHGIAHIRGQTISVIDLRAATGGTPIKDTSNCFIIIAEYNRSTQGFLVQAVERIINIHWQSIMPPPKGAGRSSYLTAVTEIDGEMVEILDVEKILDEISPVNTELSEEVHEQLVEHKDKEFRILVVDDSVVARKQIKNALTTLGMNIETANNGREALEKLLAWHDEYGDNFIQEFPLIISDIEMPEMDGYTLTAEIRNNEKFKGIRIVLHTSLSGVFNEALVQKVGADDFIAKFNPPVLAAAVDKQLRQNT